MQYNDLSALRGKEFIMTTSTSIKTIVSTLNNLNYLNVPSSCLSDDGTQVTGHWSTTKDDMVAHLGRTLTDDELTCLSLTRAFGPTPILSEDESKAIFSKIWHDGNNGEWLEWYELSEVLTGLSMWAIILDSGGYSDWIEVTEDNSIVSIKKSLDAGNQTSYTKRWVYELFAGTMDEVKTRALDIAYEDTDGN